MIPVEEESYNHTARVCKIGPDGKLYISLGQPFNVAPAEKLDLYNEVGIGGMIRINTDGTGREVYTYGIRNSVGHDFHPVTGELWFTDNQVDGMGDDIPPGELNRQTTAGQHFGFPCCQADVVRLAAGRGATRVYLHAFLDGRDTPPRSAEPSLRKAQALFAELGCGRVASITGRYYAMDRDNRWDRVHRAYEAIRWAESTPPHETDLDALLSAADD